VWINQGGVQGGTVGQFADSGQALGSGFTDGVALGDVDADNDPDAVTVNYPGANQLWRNEGISGLETLYQVRDEVLDTTEQGQHYRNLFYLHSPEILTLIMKDESLRAAGYETLVMWLPNLESLVDNAPESNTITEGQVGAVDNFLTELAEAGSPNLQETLMVERAVLPPLTDFVGMTMVEAKIEVVGGYTTYLPMITNGSAVGQRLQPQPEFVTASQTPVMREPTVIAGGPCVAVCVLGGGCR
jgi:hypothetical protein